MKVGVILCLVLVIFASFVGYVTHVNACCGGGVAFGYHSATNPVSPVSPTCDANVAHTVYSYSLASSTTINLNTATCTAGQDLIFIYTQTAGGVAITYSNTGVIEDWKANCNNTATCNQPVLSGNGDTDIFKFEYDTLPATPVFHEVGQALNVPPNYIINPMTTLGDVLYGGASGTPIRIAGNTTNIPQELNSTGAGGLATAPVFSTLPIFDVETNATSTGTTVNKLAKQSGGKWVISGTGDTTIDLDLVNYNAGTSGSVGLIVRGAGSCVFDSGGVTQDHAFGESTSTGGNCTDLGTVASACSGSAKVLGQITNATTAGAGTYTVDKNPGLCVGAGAGGGYTTINNNGSALTQRSTANISAGLAASDNSGSTRTEIRRTNLADDANGNFYTRDDFLGMVNTTGSAYSSNSGQYILNSTGATVNTNNDSTVGHIGQWNLVTDTTTAHLALLDGYDKNGGDWFPAAGGTIFTYQTRFELGSVTTNGYYGVGLFSEGAFGTGGTDFTGTHPRGAWCDVTNTASAANWACHTDDGTTVNSPSTTATTADTNYHILKITETSSTVTFYFDGTQIAQSAANIYTAHGQTPQWEAKVNSGTTAQTITIDAWDFLQ